MSETTSEARITTHLTSNLVTCRFRADRTLFAGGPVFYRAKEQAGSSALARKLLELEGVVAVKIGADTLSVTRDSYEDWPSVTRKVVPLLREQIASGQPAVAPGTKSNMPSAESIRARAEEVLEAQINPAVAAHGGVISLIDVKDATIYVKLGGGCQGCGMASVTLKQGVEQAFRDAIPELDDVLDTTDHASGTNPYYSPSSK